MYNVVIMYCMLEYHMTLLACDLIIDKGQHSDEQQSHIAYIQSIPI